jgi:hypothetical protein
MRGSWNAWRLEAGRRERIEGEGKKKDKKLRKKRHFFLHPLSFSLFQLDQLVNQGNDPNDLNDHNL